MDATCDLIREVPHSNECGENLYPDESVWIPNHSAWSRAHYHQRIAEFKLDKIGTGDIVFLGNSITEQGGDWSSRLAFQSIHNRGIAGDVTDGVLLRLCEIIHAKPKAVFILIGINDLINGSITSAYVSNNVLKIAKQITTQSPATVVYIQTVLPTRNVQLIEKIRKTNQLLLAAATPSNVTVVDTHTLFSTADELMDPHFTEDGIHLSEAGYQFWSAILRIYIDRLR